MDEYLISSSSSLPSEATECEVLEDWLGKCGTDKINEALRKFTVTNTKSRLSLSVQLMNYGATITGLKLKDPFNNNIQRDIVLGFNTVEEYYDNTPYFGSVIGRCANRIDKGKFTLKNTEYKLAVNNGPNHLHGGIKGFDKQFFDSHVQGNSIVFSYTSSDGEEGYPGIVYSQVKYTVTDADELVIEYQAKSNKPTPVNLTNHTYFNFAGHSSNLEPGYLKEHYIAINASHYTPIDNNMIPTGKLAAVCGSPFDLTKLTKMGNIFEEFYNGLDHNYCLKAESNKELKLAAFVYYPKSNLSMEVHTTCPGIQFYMGSFIPEDLKGKNGISYGKYSGFCLETQYFPNFINQPNFPQSLIYPGNEFSETTVYKFKAIQACDLRAPCFSETE